MLDTWKGHRITLQETAYLPKQVYGVGLLAEEGTGWRAQDDSGGTYHGIAYRRTKNLDDEVDDHSAVLEWGNHVHGEDEGDGWVRCLRTRMPEALCPTLQTQSACICAG